jgi:hypothetical protein
MWLDNDDNDREKVEDDINGIGQNNGTSVITTTNTARSDKASLRQQYCIGQLWCQTPDHNHLGS